MALPNARNQYLKTQIDTASKEQLVVMLFDGIIRFTEQARKAINDNEIEDSHHALMRAQAIIMELICTVDKEKGGSIADNLLSLHAYAFNCLIVCNMHKDVTKIDEVQKIYRELRDGWVQAMDSLGIGSNV
ncbi:MAG: flagellar export chaperone FliS, partial [Planctomycetes bacterium]|nr:flagellar export chaperone FliS [Planctomycetota bacterium]